MKNTSKINPLKKLIPCLLGMMLMVSMMYSCEDDNDNLSNMEQLVDKIAQMREQMSKLAESLEKRKKTTEAMSEAAEALKQAASQSSSSSTSEALRTAAKAIQTAASALLTGSKKSALLEAAKALAEAAKDKDEGKDEEASKKMKKALELMKKSMKGESTQEEASETTKASETTITVKTVTDFYAPLNKGYVTSPPKTTMFVFGELYWFQIDTFTKFDFATGKKVAEDSNEWDFALAGNIMIINGGQKMHDVCDHPERFTRAIGPHEIPPMTQEQCKVDEVQPDRTGNAAIYFVDDYNFDEIKDAEKDLAKSEAKKWTQDSTEELALDKLDVALFAFTHSGYHYYPMDGILVFRTRDGKHYAKVKMISCVRSGKSSDVTKQEERTDAMCYTFKYAYNASESSDLNTSSTPSSNKKEQPTEHQLILNPL